MIVPTQYQIRGRLGTFWVLLLALCAAGCRRAPEAAASGYYSGRLVDGRTVWFSLDFEKTDHICMLHLAGTAGFPGNNIAVSNHSDISVVFETERDSAPEGPYITGLRGHFSGKPTVFSGMLMTSNAPQGISLLATNIARFDHLRRSRGLKIGSRGGGAKFDSTFPKFPGTNRFQSAVNKQFIADMRAEAAEATTNGYDNAWTAWKDGGGSSWQWECLTDIQISFASDEAMSFYEDGWDYAGGAHGNTSLSGFNYVFANGRLNQFLLADLFRPGSEWEKALSSACLRDLHRQQASNVELKMIKEFKAADLAVFTYDERGLVIHFPPYQVASYAEGSFHVFVPWSELRPMLNPTGPAKFIPGALKP